MASKSPNTNSPVKQDRRVARTHTLLAKALIALTIEHGYDAVTIRDITQHADIGYATFFRHYSDKEALLQDVLKVFVGELTERVTIHSEDADPILQGKLIFEYVLQHNALCRVLLASGGIMAVLQAVGQSESITLPHRASINLAPTIPAEIALNHWVSATIALIDWWLQHDMPYPVQRMAEIYRDLIVLPTRALN